MIIYFFNCQQQNCCNAIYKQIPLNLYQKQILHNQLGYHQKPHIMGFLIHIFSRFYLCQSNSYKANNLKVQNIATVLLPIVYKYEASASPKYILFTLHLTALKPRHLIVCKPHTNSSISIDSLCDTLISIIRAKIALRSHGLSSI